MLARCRVVPLSVLVALTPAPPRSTRKRTVSRWPPWLAHIKAVIPFIRSGSIHSRAPAPHQKARNLQFAALAGPLWPLCTANSGLSAQKARAMPVICPTSP